MVLDVVAFVGVLKLIPVVEIPREPPETIVEVVARKATDLGRLRITSPKDGERPLRYWVTVSDPRTGTRVPDCVDWFEPGEVLPGIPPGRYALHVRPDPGKTVYPVDRIIRVHAGDNPVSVPVRLGATLDVRVVLDRKFASREAEAAFLKSIAVTFFAVCTVLCWAPPQRYRDWVLARAKGGRS